MQRKLLALSLVLFLLVPFIAPIHADSISPGVKRIYGANRFETSIKVAKNLKRELGLKKFPTIVVASGMSFPDALSGSCLAQVNSAPIILVSPTRYAHATEYIKANLARGGKVYILGGEGAVSGEIANEIGEIAETVRLSGSDRYITNLSIMREAIFGPEIEYEDGLIPPGVTPPAAKKVDIMVCSGKDFPDALSAAALGQPILLVGRTITPDQMQFLEECKGNINKVWLIGGTGAVSSPVEDYFRTYGKPYERIKGDNRYLTSTAVAERFFPTAKQAVIATGANFPDGLTGSTLAKAKNCPLLLTASTYQFQEGHSYLVNKDIRTATVLGGPQVISLSAVGLNPSGSRKTGFVSVGDGNKYYINSSYKVEKGRIFTDHGKQYFANDRGIIITNTTIKISGSNYKVDSSGVLTKEVPPPPKTDKVIYLTFDDGPGPYTDQLINILNKYGAKATFFVNPNRPAYLYCIKKAYASGHAIGNHTYSHDYAYVYSSTNNFWSDFNKANNIIAQQTGTTTNLLRFPGGSSNTVSRAYSYGIMSRLASQCNSYGYKYFDWNVDSNDAGGTTTSSGVYYNIVNGVSGNRASVVLCHDIKAYTVNAIEDVIIWGQRNGYSFLALTTNSPTAHHGINN